MVPIKSELTLDINPIEEMEEFNYKELIPNNLYCDP